MKSVSSASTTSTMSTVFTAMSEVPVVTMTSSGCGVDILLNEENEEYEEILTSNNMFSLTKDDIEIDPYHLLGQGGFCCVYPVHVRHGITKRFNPDLPPFALKKVRVDILEGSNPRLVEHICLDLVNEAKIMKKLLHANIVQIIGHSNLDSRRDGLFVVMEKLESTLDEKMAHWTQVRGLFKQVTPKETVFLRLKDVAAPIANALQYMHQNKILYRDLKPSNVGFDHTGKVKLFDFGFAVHNPNDDLLHEMAGTLRYMCPEMRNSQPYSFPADVYSFAILLWQIVTSRLPLEKEIPEMESIAPEMVPKDKRPNLKFVESKELSELMDYSWRTDPDERWAFPQILSCLTSVVQQMDDQGRLSAASSKASRFGRRMKKSSSSGTKRKGRRLVSSMNNY